MKKRLFAFIVQMTIVVTGIFIWFSSNHNRDNDPAIPSALAVLFALTFSILTELQLRIILFATTIGVEVALVIKIIIDWRFDPTSHNLFPLEVLIDLIIILIASLIGVAIGFIYRKFRKRKFFDNK
jgi:predicted neutral ceramidase superfamily lipid hydrolase